VRTISILLFDGVEELDAVVSSAGIGTAVHLVARLAGEERAREARRDIEFDPARRG